MEFVITRNDDRARARSDRALGSRSSADMQLSDVALAKGTFRLLSRTFEKDIAVQLEEDRGLVLLGTHRADPTTLNRELGTYHTPSDVFSIYRRIPGSYFTILGWGNEVYVFGTLSNNRRVLVHAEEGLAASDGDLLRRACDLELDEEYLPLTLMMMQPPSLLNDRMPWRGVRGVRHTDAVVLSGNGVRTESRWTPPSLMTRLTGVAPLLQEAIAEAVDARHSVGRVSTDLSGGMDSTTVAFFAHRVSPHLLTVFRPGIDQSNDDQAWTQRAMRALPGSDHIEISADANAPWFSGWLDPGEHSLESPLPSSRTSEYFRTIADAVSSAGSVRHLTGIGGDELFHPGFSLIRDHSRSHPAWALRAARAAQAMGRWTSIATMRALYSRETYSAWRRRAANSLMDPTELQGTPPMDWEPRPLLPPWAASSSVGLVRQILLEDTEDVRPSWNLSQHEALSLITLSGSLIRRFSPLFEARGVSYEAPLLDDRLIELALSIDPVDRIQGAAYKPVLSAAGAGVVPADLLGRQTKGDYSREAFAGIRHSRPAILAGFEESELARRGLIDVNRFRAALTGVHTDTRMFQFLDPTLTAEAWLRRVGQPLQTTEVP